MAGMSVYAVQPELFVARADCQTSESKASMVYHQSHANWLHPLEICRCITIDDNLALPACAVLEDLLMDASGDNAGTQDAPSIANSYIVWGMHGSGSRSAEHRRVRTLLPCGVQNLIASHKSSSF